MKKLLQINSVINSGSTGRIAEEIGQLAIQQGWESYIAYGRNDKESASEKINIGDKIGVLWHVFLTRFFDLHGFGSQRATRKLIARIDEIQPDIIHLHNVHGYYLNIKLLFDYLSAQHIPIVWTLHDCWTVMGHGAYFKSKKKKGTEEFWTAPKSEYPENWFLHNDWQNYKHKKELFGALKKLTLVPVSNWLGEIVKNSFLKKYPTKRIYNGVDLEKFQFCRKESFLKKHKIENKSVLLGVASVWEARKGLDDFITLSKLLKDDEVIVLVGVTDDIIKTMPPNIIGIKRTESVEELVQWYSSATVVLNLSYQETFGLTTVEGYACGIPTVVYNATASPELVIKETGFVVEQGDIEGVRKSIDKIRTNGKEFYLKACRERAEKHYDKNQRFQEYLELYKEMLLKE